MKPAIKIIISGGGTGGHIYPAIAIANEIKNRYPLANILFVGAKNKMEMEKIPQAGYPIKGLWISGIQRKISLKNLLFPIKLLHSLYKANIIIKKFKPNIAIGTGGFASGPTLMMATQKKIPTLIQEQNSYPGITNKLLSKKARKICVAYDNLTRFFPKDKMIKTGNPVRQDLLNIQTKISEGKNFFKLDTTKKTILILGGSLGARKINQLIEKNLAFFQKQNLQVIWQCGTLYFEEYQQYNQQNKYKNIQIHQFITKMDLAYASADFIISRAGASSISELCIVGKPTIFIPSPNVSEDHQTKNALAIVQKKGAILIKENQLETFQKVMQNLLSNIEKQKSLSKNIKALALPNATKQIVNEIEKLISELNNNT